MHNEAIENFLMGLQALVALLLATGADDTFTTAYLNPAITVANLEVTILKYRAYAINQTSGTAATLP